MSDYRGRFVWYELLTSEPDAAIDFYGSVVGWRTQSYEAGEQPYTLWMNGERPLGGVMELPEQASSAGAPSHWLPYVGTPDIDATVARAVELGGSVMVQPMDIPDAGRIAVLADPQGAVFAVYTMADPEDAGAEEAPEHGDFSWHELATTDYEAAFEFYSELFGWEKSTAMDMGEGAMYQMYRRPGGQDLGGMYNKMPEQPVAAWLLYARVGDIDRAAATISDSGGEVLNGPMEVPGGDRVAQCMDPQGAVFAVHGSGG